MLDRMNRDALAKGRVDLSPDQVVQLRPSYTTTDVEQVVDLTHEFHAPLVCSLLLAYGYARDDRDLATVVERADIQTELPGDDSEDEDL